MRNDIHAAITIRSEGKARLNVVSGKIGKILQDFRDRHSATQIIENIRHRDPRVSNARFAAANARVDDDSLPVSIRRC